MGMSIRAAYRVRFVSDDVSTPAPHGHEHLRYEGGNEAPAEGLKEGLYKLMGATFHSENWTYHGYGIWRRHLAQMIGQPDIKAIWQHPDPSLPFIELLNSHDNLATFGPRTSAKLLKDFRDWYQQAISYSKKLPRDPKGDEMSGEEFLLLYEDFKQAFEIVGPNGAVTYG